MQRCEVCGNEYARAMVVQLEGAEHVFDCFECAIHALAPTCERCGCRVIGHGAESQDGSVYCGAHCANAEGVVGVSDHS